MIKEGDVFVTVGRYGQKCANFRSGGHKFSMPVWVAKRYVAKLNYVGEMKWFFVEHFGNSTSGWSASQKFVDNVKSEHSNFMPYIAHTMRVKQPPSMASVVLKQIETL